MNFHIANPADVAQFLVERLSQPCKESERMSLNHALAVMLYNVAQGRGTVKIDGKLSQEFTQWLIG